MIIPIIILVVIPIFLGIVFVPPFDQPEKFNDEIILEESGVNILYFLLIGIWAIILLRMLLQIKKGTFTATKRY
ncbi:MAG: hypothetical protein IIA83_12060 [Thaumarchaeota archaeon]|nr:hypothetical protein [Nitrososphaerota archaeon]